MGLLNCSPLHLAHTGAAECVSGRHHVPTAPASHRPPPLPIHSYAQVHSLPGLETLCRKQLEDSRVLGFRWTAHPLASQGSGPGGSGIAAGSMCCSLDGQVVLASAANEIVRLAVVADCALPAPPASLYNTRLAAAALEAAARRLGVGAGGYPARLDSQAVQQPAAAGQQQEGEAGPANAFGRFFDQAASTMTGLATTAAGTVMQVWGCCGCAQQCHVSRCSARAACCASWLLVRGILPVPTPLRPLWSHHRSWTGRGRWGRAPCSASASNLVDPRATCPH